MSSIKLGKTNNKYFKQAKKAWADIGRDWCAWGREKWMEGKEKGRGR